MRAKLFKILSFFFLAVATVWIQSCSKMDDYKKYLKDGETSYTGKIDSIKVFSGHNRVVIRGFLLSDPKVSQLRIYWDNRQDSMLVPVTRSAGIDTLTVSVPVAEGPHSFELVTFDKVGNKSITVYASGTSYGPRYETYLINRPVSSFSQDARTGLSTINWGGIELTSGALATEVVYRSITGNIKVLRQPVKDVSKTDLADYEPGSSLKYRTLFIPDASSVDTFYVNYSSSMMPEVTYFKNLGYPFARASWDGSRWGVLSDWITNSQVKNTSTGNGGYELKGGVGVMSVEGGWGLRSVTNGKIYQSTVLTPGTYSFEATGIDAGASGSSSRFFVIADRDTLPDIQDITRSIAYKPIPTATGNGSVKLEITLSQTTRIALGVVATAPGTASTGSYFKIKGITFTKN